jgi:hypothetical protein
VLIWTGNGPEVTLTWHFLTQNQKYRKIGEISMIIATYTIVTNNNHESDSGNRFPMPHLSRRDDMRGGDGKYGYSFHL